MAAQSDIRLSINPVGDHTRNASINSSVTLTAPAGATRIMIQCETQNVRYRLDKQNPTTTVGFLLSTSDSPVILETQELRVIASSSGAVIQYCWLT